MSGCAWARRAAALVLALAAGLPTAEAQPGTHSLRSALRVEGADECLDAPVLAQRVSTWLGRPEVDSRLEVRVDATKDKMGFEVLRKDKLIAERRFSRTVRDCADRRAALGLAIALAIDATILESIGVPSERVEPGKQQTDRFVLSIPVSGHAMFEVLPEVTAGIQAGFEASWERFGFAVSGLVTTPVTVGVEPGRADVLLAAGRVDGCIYKWLDRGRLAACPGFAIGRLSAQGKDFDQSLEPEVLWAAATLRLAARLHLIGPFSLEVSADGLLSVVRPHLQVKERDTGRTVTDKALPIAGASLGLGAVFSFE
jgi:hypothetical protein